MEQAKIQSDPFKEKFIFFCNGSKMTGKTDFQDYENSSLLDWADEISEKIGTAIYDDFNLSVCGEYFEKEFLEGIISVYASEDAAYKCLSLRKENHNNHIDANDRLRFLQGLAEKYNISAEPFYKLQVFCKNKDFVESNAAYAAVDTPEKAFCIVDDDISALAAYRKSTARIILSTSESNKAECIGKNIDGKKQYVWKVPAIRKTEIFNSIVDYFCVIKQIRTIADKINSVYSILDKQDQLLFTSCISVEPVYYAADIPELKIRDTYKPEVYLYPDKTADVPFQMDSDNTAILEIRDNVLAPKSAGTANVIFYTVINGEKTIFDSKPVHVSDICIESITIKPHRLELDVNEKKAISIAISPRNVSDSRITYTCSDSDVASLEAKSDGTFVITANKVGSCTFEFKAVKTGVVGKCIVEVASTFSKRVSDSMEYYRKGLLAFVVSVISGFITVLINPFGFVFFIAAGICAYNMLKALALKHLEENKCKNTYTVLAILAVLFVIVSMTI